MLLKKKHLLTVLQCTYSFPYGVVTEETDYLSKRHWPLSPGVFPTRKVMDTQLIEVGLIQLPKRREERERGEGGKGGRERERRKEVEKERDQTYDINLRSGLTFHRLHQRWCS